MVDYFCSLCGTPVHAKTKPPKTCKACLHPYRHAIRRNREVCQEAAALLGQALAAIGSRAQDLAPKAQLAIAEAIRVLRSEQDWQPTLSQREARRDQLSPHRRELLGASREEAVKILADQDQDPRPDDDDRGAA